MAPFKQLAAGVVNFCRCAARNPKTSIPGIAAIGLGVKLCAAGQVTEGVTSMVLGVGALAALDAC